MTASPQDSVSLRPVVYFGGQDSPMVRGSLLGLQLEEGRGGLSSLEVRLRNSHSFPEGRAGRGFDDSELIALGALVSVGMGEESQPGSMFYGVVTAIEESHGQGAPELLVLAEDALQKARLARRTKVYPEFSMTEFCNALADRLGLTAHVSGFTDALGTQVQINESDLSFVRRLLDQYDGEIQIVEEELHVRPISEVFRGELELSGDQFESLRFCADLAHQVTQVTVGGWDSAGGQRLSATSDPSDLGPGTGMSGAQWMVRALGERSEHIGHVPVRNADEAQAMADAVHSKRAREFVRLSGTIQGNPHIRVGTHLRISGVSSRFENSYVVTQACHRYEKHGEDAGRGYQTDFEAECAYLKES